MPRRPPRSPRSSGAAGRRDTAPAPPAARKRGALRERKTPRKRRPDPPQDGYALAERLHKAAIGLLRLLRRQDGASGITAPRLSTLSVLVFGGPRTLGALAAAEQVRPPTMTRLVAALEAEGLVARETPAHDGRLVILAATRKGRALLLAGRQRRLAALAELLARRSAAERGALQTAVPILEALLSSGPSSGPAGPRQPGSAPQSPRPSTTLRAHSGTSSR